MNPKGKKSRVSIKEIEQVPDDIKSRTDAVLKHFEDNREFYQSEVSKYSRWYIGLTVVTLVGTALTPILLLLATPGEPTYMKVIQAAPSALAGLAAALNTAFRYRESWAQNYYTLSALINEYQRFIARASPDYGPDKNEAETIDIFQNNISKYVMSEVESWRAVMLTSDAAQVTKEGGNKKEIMKTNDPKQ